jgi:hypothetical protein
MKEILPLWEQFLKEWRQNGGRFPHCDGRVLHQREKCRYCASPEFDNLHEFRARAGINYTGEFDPSRRFPCPGDYQRGSKSINSWRGNVAVPEGCECGGFEIVGDIHGEDWKLVNKKCPVHPDRS